MNLDAPSWLVAFLDGVSVWDALLVLAGIILAVIFIKKKGWRTVVAFAHGVINYAEVLAAVQALPEFIERTDARQDRFEKKLDEVHHEVNYNNGTSVKDSQKRTEDAINDIIIPALEQLRATDDELRADIEDTRNPKEQP